MRPFRPMGIDELYGIRSVNWFTEALHIWGYGCNVGKTNGEVGNESTQAQKR